MINIKSINFNAVSLRVMRIMIIVGLRIDYFDDLWFYCSVVKGYGRTSVFNGKWEFGF